LSLLLPAAALFVPVVVVDAAGEMVVPRNTNPREPDVTVRGERRHVSTAALCLRVCVCVCGGGGVRVCMRMCMRACVCVCMRVRTCEDHTHTHTHTHTH
jgi:hypothetical protein